MPLETAQVRFARLGAMLGAERGDENEARRNRGGGGEGGLVFAGEFLEAVHGSWGAGEDGFVGKVTLDVGGQGAGRLVAAAAVFFEGFHHNPIELIPARSA